MPIRPVLRAVVATMSLGALALIAGCATAAAPAAGSPTATEAATASIALQLRFTPSVQFAASYAAEDAGYYADENLDVTITPGGPGVAIEPLLMQGTVDIGITAPSTTARAVTEGADLVIVAAGYQTDPGAIISLAENPIETTDDLVGARIGVVSANTSFASFLVANDIAASDVTIVPIQGDASPLISGQVDGIYGLVTSHMISLQQEGYDPVALKYAENGMDGIDMSYAVSASALQDPATRDAIVRFLMAEVQGWRAIVEDPAMAATLMLDTYAVDLGLDADQQLAQAEAQVSLIAPDADTRVLELTETQIEATLATLSALGVTADESLFDTSLIEEAYERLDALG